MNDLIYQEDSYAIIGWCMEIHNHLGHGFAEVVYKDALEYELCENNIVYQREKEYVVNYKKAVLPHKFYADITVFDKIIVEVKCVKAFTEEHMAQAINYLKVSQNKLALLINFGRGKLEYKRVVY